MHDADDEDAYSDLEPAVAEAAKNTIDVIKELCTMKGLAFGYSRDLLIEILHKAYQFADIQHDARLRTIKVASNAAAGIIVHRPFENLSTPAGLIFIDNFLDESGFNMQLDSFKAMDRQVKLIVGLKPTTESQLQYLIETYLRQWVGRKE